jgi:ribosomal protein L1
LLDFCKENNLFVSGGSDYHGTNKKNIEMAVGKGNLKIEAKYIKPWVNMMEDALVSHAKVAEEKIIEQILKVTNEYEKTKDATIKKQYLQLIMDKEKVENIDIKTIKKYVN